MEGHFRIHAGLPRRLNPRTKEAVEIPATTVPVFKAGKALKEKIDK